MAYKVINATRNFIIKNNEIYSLNEEAQTILKSENFKYLYNSLCQILEKALSLESAITWEEILDKLPTATQLEKEALKLLSNT